MSTVKTEDLKRIFDHLILKLEYLNVKQIELNTGFYRFIPADVWAKFDDNKSELFVGDLNDDIKSLMLLINEEDRVCTFVDFDRCASVLKAISQELNPPNEE